MKPNCLNRFLITRLLAGSSAAFGRFLAASTAVFIVGTSAHAATWVPTAAGTFAWDNNANWTNPATFPNAVDDIALINNNPTVNQIIQLNQAITVGSLTIGDNNGTQTADLAPNGGSLTFDVTAGSASLIRTQTGTGATTISSGITLNDDLIVSLASGNAFSAMTLSGNIGEGVAGKSITKNNATLTLALSGTNSYTGTTTINAGTLNFTTTASLYNNTPASWTKGNITVNSGGIVGFNVGGGAAEFTELQFNTLFTELATSINDNGLKLGSGIGLTVATGTSVTSTFTDSTGTGGGTLSVTKAGAGTLNLVDSTFSSSFLGNGGVINITGASTLIGGTDDKVFTMNACAVRHSAGKIKVSDTTLADAANGLPNSQFAIGATTTANYELSGSGTLEVVNPQRFIVRNGQFTQTGGDITVSYTGAGGNIGGATNPPDGRALILGGSTTRGVVYATAGTATFTTTNVTAVQSAIVISDTIATGSSELTLAGTANWSLSGPAGFVTVTRAAGRLGTLNLNGSSVLTTNRVSDGAGIAVINFDGGTLRAVADDASFLSGITNVVRIYQGGAKIDTNGKNVTISKVLANPAGNVLTSIPVTSGGSYTGAPVVAVSGGGGTGATAVANFDAGTVTGFTITSPGTGFTSAPTVTIAAGSGNGSGLVLGTATIGAEPTPGGLTKQGAGTLTLNQASSYAGGTTVEAGTLLANNTTNSATGTGPVTVKSTATLGGTGAVSGAVILESGATLAPGASIESLATGPLTVPAGATFAAEIDSSSSTTDSVNVTGTGDLTLGGALTVTDIAGTPGSITPGTKLTLITYAGTPTGEFTGKPEGSTFPVGSNTFKIRYADAGAVTLEAMSAGTGYAAWASTNAPSQTAAQDYDNDGVSNGAEWVLGGSATTNDADKLPTASTTTVPGSVVFTFVRDQASKTAGTAVSIQVGTDLDIWTTYAVPDSGTVVPVTVTDIGGGKESVTLTVLQAPDTKKFARLNVVITP